jgi:hypothetical protein
MNMERRATLLTHRPPSKNAAILWLVITICATGAALLAAMAVAQDASAQVTPEPRSGWFQRCALAKTGYFDPIVYPGTPPRVGHRHLFFGSTAISYNSRASDLQAGATTCRFQDGTVDPVDGGNNSSYWAPDLKLRNGQWASGAQVNAYYRKGAASVDAQKVEPFPKGLKMVIRDRNNKKTGVEWYCSGLSGEGSNGKFAPRPYDCDPATPYKYVTTHITFPQCGTGATNSPDHISHMVYAGDNGCPKTHPRVFPRLQVTVKYNTSLGARSRLASSAGEDPAHSDPATGFHADYFEGWKPGTLQRFVDACIKGGINCRDGDRLP